MKRAIVVRPDGYEILDAPDETYEFISEHVGGWIQVVPCSSPVSVYCNEEGKIMDPPLPPNRLATRSFGEWLQPGDIIAGNVVVLGQQDEEGYDTGLSDLDVSMVQALLRGVHA